MKKLLIAIMAFTLFTGCILPGTTAAAAGDEPVFYDFKPADGTDVIPFGEGRTMKCYYPQSGNYSRPEIYAWGNSTLSMKGDFVHIKTVNPEWASYTFDTVPAELYVDDFNHSWLSVTVKSEKPFEGNVRLRDLGSKYQMLVPVEFNGEWQKIIIDMSAVEGWYTKDMFGEYTVEAGVSAYSVDTKAIYGGMSFGLPGSFFTEGYELDTFGFFTSIEQAYEYKGNVPEAEVYVGIPLKVDPDAVKEQVREIAYYNETIAENAELEKKEREEGGTVFYDFRPNDGTSTIPFGQGRNMQCYYPQFGQWGRPEIYTWATSVLSADGNYTKVTVNEDALARFTFDTVPSEMYTNSFENRYLSMVLKAEKAFDGRIRLRSLGGQFNKYVDVKFTGEWQKITVDLGDRKGWYTKDDNGEYTVPASVAPYSKEGNDFFGGFTMALPGKSSCRSYHIDYLGLFKSKERAEDYMGLAKREEAALAELMKNLLPSTEYYMEKAKDTFIYELRPQYGEEIPFGKGKYIDCFYP